MVNPFSIFFYENFTPEVTTAHIDLQVVILEVILCQWSTILKECLTILTECSSIFTGWLTILKAYSKILTECSYSDFYSQRNVRHFIISKFMITNLCFQIFLLWKFFAQHLFFKPFNFRKLLYAVCTKTAVHFLFTNALVICLLFCGWLFKLVWCMVVV